MLDISRDQLEKLYDRQQLIIKGVGAIAVIDIITYIVIRVFHMSGLLFLIIVNVVLFIAVLFAKKALIPEGQSSKVLKEAMTSLQYDHCSDRALDMLYSKMPMAQTFPEKAYLTLFVAETHMQRGEMDKAISTLDTIDRSQFIKYPNVGMSFYDDIVGLYYELGDYDSAMRAYKDGEPFIRECSQRNYSSCSTAIEILIHAYAASGDPRHALDLRLMKNDFQNRFNKDVEKKLDDGGTPLKMFLRGMVFLDTAELFYMCGDFTSAAQAVDNAGPLLTRTPFYLDRANRLSAAIRERM
ncbi:MAG: hypothetical protein IKR73_07210 [Oscillospiraceae bacterium]|nr:hypothetical protein [Oscillospiraceae bacterium]